MLLGIRDYNTPNLKGGAGGNKAFKGEKRSGRFERVNG